MSLKSTIGQFGGYLIGIGFIASLSILAYQGLFWFQTDKWLAIPLHTIFTNLDLTFLLDMEWQSIAKIVFWVFELPLSLVVFILSSTIGYILLTLLDD